MDEEPDCGQRGSGYVWCVSVDYVGGVVWAVGVGDGGVYLAHGSFCCDDEPGVVSRLRSCERGGVISTKLKEVDYSFKVDLVQVNS